MKKSSEVVQTFRSARHGRPKGLHYDSLGRHEGCLTSIFSQALWPDRAGPPEGGRYVPNGKCSRLKGLAALEILRLFLGALERVQNRIDSCAPARDFDKSDEIRNEEDGCLGALYTVNCLYIDWSINPPTRAPIAPGIPMNGSAASPRGSDPRDRPAAKTIPGNAPTARPVSVPFKGESRRSITISLTSSSDMRGLATNTSPRSRRVSRTMSSKDEADRITKPPLRRVPSHIGDVDGIPRLDQTSQPVERGGHLLGRGGRCGNEGRCRHSHERPSFASNTRRHAASFCRVPFGFCSASSHDCEKRIENGSAAPCPTLSGSPIPVATYRFYVASAFRRTVITVG